MPFRLMRIIDNETSESTCFEAPNGIKAGVIETIEECVVESREVLPALLEKWGDKLEKIDSNLDDKWGVCADNVYPGVGDLWYLFEEKFAAKISKKGSYLVHPGVTMISFAKNYKDYAELHAFLQEKISEYYSILPLESLHVTIHNMFTKSMMKDYYDQMFSHVYKVCKEWNDSRGDGTFKARATNVYFYGTVGVKVDLETSAHDLVIKAQNMVRNQAGMKDDGLQFHMTFGYRYTKKDMPESLAKEVTKKIAEVMGAIPIELEEPKVCSFESMMEFEPF